MLSLNEVNRSKVANGKNYSGATYELGSMILCKDDPCMLITSESKRIRVWDLRIPLANGFKAAITIDDPSQTKE